MAIRCGGSCGGRFSRPIIGITSYENRILQNNEHSYFWQDCKFCIDNKIFLIVNIDSYITNSRWTPTNAELRNFILKTKYGLKAIGADKTNCRFTVDNESDEWDNFGNYCNRVRVIHDALNGEFDLGAGNFRTGARNWYESLAIFNSEDYLNFEVFDVHYQDGLNSMGAIATFSSWLLSLKNEYGIKRIAVTEGNNFYNISVISGHELLKFQISEAERIGCEDFCFVYANWMHNGIESDDDMSYNYNFNQVSHYWPDMKNYILSKKPIIEDEDMKLEQLYMKGSKGIGVKFIQKVVNKQMNSNLLIDGIWGDKTEEGVRAFQTAKELLVDGKVGIQTFPAMIEEYPNIWNQIEYAWAIGVR